MALYDTERRELVDAHSATNVFLSPPPTDTNQDISARFQRIMSLVGFNSKYGLTSLEDEDVCRVDNIMPCELITWVDAIYQHDNGKISCTSANLLSTILRIVLGETSFPPTV